jgi:predicted dienelactone hydrolase
MQQEQLATKLVQAWSADMGFALDQVERLNASDPSSKFLGRVDMQRVGVFGHSLGGATALQFCMTIPDAKRASMLTGLHWAVSSTQVSINHSCS